MARLFVAGLPLAALVAIASALDQPWAAQVRRRAEAAHSPTSWYSMVRSSTRPAVNYRRAAEILAEHVLAHRGDLDLVVFPLAGCWRQHVELRPHLSSFGGQGAHELADPLHALGVEPVDRLVEDERPGVA